MRGEPDPESRMSSSKQVQDPGTQSLQWEPRSYFQIAFWIWKNTFRPVEPRHVAVRLASMHLSDDAKVEVESEGDQKWAMCH